MLNKKNMLLVLAILFLIIADKINKQLITLHILSGRSISPVNEHISFVNVNPKGANPRKHYCERTVGSLRSSFGPKALGTLSSLAY